MKKNNKKDKLSNILKQRRMEENYSQRVCAKQLGVSVVTYQNWESGISLPSDENLKKVCDFFNFKKSELNT